MQRSWKVAAVITALAVLEYFIYFWHSAHFFQADTLFWFDHRLTSLWAFIRSFAARDPGGWYRPLTNRTIQSLLFPIVGLEPPAYRAIQFLLFLSDIVAVFALTSKLTRRFGASVIAALFFTIHTINAYTTYDLAFVPELTYTFFYIGSLLGFIRFLETRRDKSLVVSTVLFGLSLCSKESAVTLPVAAVFIAYISGFEFKKIWRSAIPHLALLILYLGFTLGHLKIASEALASLYAPPTQFEAGGYYFMAGPHLFTNAITAWSWALNLPVGLLGQWRDQTTLRSLVIWGFALLQMLILPFALGTKAWRPILAGFASFWITVLPALPLHGHFLPYYLLLPVAGFSLMVGASWTAVADRIRSERRVAVTTAIAAMFAVLILVYLRTSRSEARNNFLLGQSSRLAQTSLQDMRSLYPSIAPGTRFLIRSEDRPDLDFCQAGGGLFRTAYRDDSLQFSYSVNSSAASPGTEVLIFKDNHLQKATR